MTDFIPDSSVVPPAIPEPKPAVTPSDNYDSLFASAEQKYGLPDGLLKNVAAVESGNNPAAVSRKGARGLMQFMPETAVRYGVNPEDPASSIDGAGRYLRDLTVMFGGDLEKAVAAYNAGENAVQKYNGVPPYKETQNYVSKVLNSIVPAASAADNTPPRAPAKQGGFVTPEMSQIFQEAMSHPDFQAMPADQQEATRIQLFRDYVAPNVPTNKLVEARKEFDADTAGGTTAFDVAKSFASGALNAVGETFHGAGDLLAKGINAAGEAIGHNPELRAIDPLRSIEDAINESKTVAGKRAAQAFQIEGDTLDPSTWKVTGLTPGGALQFASQTFGQYAPQVLLALVTGGASTGAQAVFGAVVGGLQGYGGGATQERDFVMNSKSEELAQKSTFYKSLRDQGVPEPAAREATAKKAELGGGLGNGIPSALEGAVEQLILKAKIPIGIGKGVTKAVTGTLMGAAGQGAEEDVEQRAQNIGSNIAIGGNRPVGEDTLVNAVGGFVGGAGFGAATSMAPGQRHARPVTEKQTGDQDSADAVPLSEVPGNEPPTAQPVQSAPGPLTRAANIAVANGVISSPIPEMGMNVPKMGVAENATNVAESRTPPALPAPRMIVTPEGVTATEAQLDQQRADRESRRGELGFTSDVERAGTTHPGRAYIRPPKPFDARIQREDYRAKVKKMADDLVEGGGVTYLRDDKGTVTGRTPSVNPAWFQGMSESPEHQMTVAQVKHAVQKALENQPLGVREARVLTLMLNEAKGERTDPRNIEYVRNELNRARDLRKATKTGLPPTFAYFDDADLYAGQVFEEQAYNPEWNGTARAVYELAQEARNLDEQGTDALLEQYERSDDVTIARALWRFIAEKKHAEQKESSASGVRGAEGAPGDRAGIQAEKDHSPADGAGSRLAPLTPPAARTAATQPTTLDALRADKKFRALLKQAGDPHIDSSATGDFAQGWVDASEGKDPNQEYVKEVPDAGPGRYNPRNYYLTGYLANRDGEVVDIRASNVPMHLAILRGEHAPVQESDLSTDRGQSENVDKAAHEAATSPKNDLPEPTDSAAVKATTEVAKATAEAVKEIVGAVKELKNEVAELWVPKAQNLSAERSVPAADTGNGHSAFFQKTFEAGRRGLKALRNILNSRAFLGEIDNLLKIPSDAGRGVKSPDTVKSETTTRERNFERVLADTKVLRDILGSDAFSQHGFSGLDTETQRLVLSHMLGLGHDSEVFKSVISLIPIDVMNNLARLKLSPERLFNDPAVLKSAISGDLRLGIASGRDVADALIRAIALAGAEISASHVGANLERPTGNGIAAGGTANRDLGHESNNTRNDGQSEVLGQDTAMFSRRGVSGRSPLTALWTMLAQQEEAFQQPTSIRKEMRAIAADIDPGIKVEDVSWSERARSVRHKWEFVMPDGRKAYITERTDGRIVLNAARLKAGASRGNALYNIASTYAHNNGRIFIGDPLGLSPAALYRRLENMISSSLRFGTTDHLQPHPDQVNRLNLQWKNGDFDHNLEQMLLSSYNSVVKFVPEIKDVVYNFETNQFEKAGQPFTDADFKRLSDEAREAGRAGSEGGAAQSRTPLRSVSVDSAGDEGGGKTPFPIGGATLKRAAVTNTLVQAAGGQEQGRVGVLGVALRKLREGVADTPLKRILYSKTEARPSAGLSVSGVRAILAQPLERLSDTIPIEIVQSVEDLPFGAPGDTRGVHYNGRVWLVADHLTETDARRVLTHEVVGHLGLETMLGPREFKALVNNIRMMKLAGNKAIEQAAFRVFDTHGKLDAETEAKEILAYLAENGIQNSLLRRVVAQIRLWLARMGLGNLQTAEIENLIARAARHVEGAETVPEAQAVPAYSKKTPIFYSPLHRALEGVKQMKSPADQWKAIIKNLPGVKTEEVEWLGVNEWLDEQKGSVTKDALLDFIRANQIYVREVIKESGRNIETVEEAKAIIRQETDLDPDELGNKTDAGLIRYAQDLLDNADTETTKFASYQTPGGENYRELLLTLPTKHVSVSLPDLETWVKQQPWYLAWEAQGKNWDKANSLYQQWAEREERANQKDRFYSGHFDEPNILAHVRFNERIDEDGKRVLFIEEIQSDWHQKGRKEGYGQKALFKVIDKYGGWYNSVDSLELANKQAADIGGTVDEYAAGLVPDAPFKTTWPMLAMKRMIRYAAENGFDRIAWTTGEQQAERYDLSKTVERIVWYLQDDGQYRITGDTKDRGVAFPDQTVPKDKLADVVGKDVADKIIHGNGARKLEADELEYKAVGELRGLDLKTGGEGMVAFYDQMLPSMVNKYVKKWGAKVGETTIPGAKTLEGKNADIERRLGMTIDEFNALPLDERTELAKKAEPGNVSVHSLDITPAMREAAMQGQPMFSRKSAEATRSTGRRESLLDTLTRVPVQALGIDKITGKAYDLLLEKIGGIIPENVKAGMVSDYGLPETVSDRRSLMQAHIRTGYRATQGQLEKLLNLTRAESRVAYEWMTQNDPSEGKRLLAQLPEDSRKVLGDLKETIEKLSQNAVRLGQLSEDAYKRNAMAYLHRSYAKHELEQTEQNKAARSRAIRIFGDQYKGRGIVDAVTMDKLRSAAPDFWGRKVGDRQADAALKGGKFIRFEMRANRGEGVGALPGMEETGQLGRLQAVEYWPASEPVPAKYGNWHEAGTWEVRGTKGDKVLMWRDFTKEERARMGEIDEVRYAVAKTLHQMIHDTEAEKYLEWLADNHAKPRPEDLPAGAAIAEAKESLVRSFKKDEWVKVPEATISGTNVKKYGKLAGLYVPGPIWNDVRQIVNQRFQPLGETYGTLLKAWKISKTALSPTVHLNNVMANFIMADWHDVLARDLVKALDVMVHPDRTGNKELLARFEDSGSTEGMYVLSELQRQQLAPLLDELRKDITEHGEDAGVINASSLIQLLSSGKIREAMASAGNSKAATLTRKAGQKMIDMYQSEDTVFRLAAFIKAKADGKTDAEAGKLARQSFLDYQINAPWIQMMRSTAFPFLSFFYRAAPMMLETYAKKPWKLMKLAMILGTLNALGYAMSGGNEDKERKVLPEEKAGSIFGLIPKLIRMPWNDAHDQPVFMDIRRFIPVGDVFDIGQAHSAVPVMPVAIPGGPLATLAELLFNRSQFTGRDIVKGTDTPVESAEKVFMHLYRSFAPNIVLLPGSYAAQSVYDAGRGKTDAFGREQSVPAALASSVGIKIGSYPRDVAIKNLKGEYDQQNSEISKSIGDLKREYARKGITADEFKEKVMEQTEKKRRIANELRQKLQ